MANKVLWSIYIVKCTKPKNSDNKIKTFLWLESLGCFPCCISNIFKRTDSLSVKSIYFVFESWSIWEKRNIIYWIKMSSIFKKKVYEQSYQRISRFSFESLLSPSSVGHLVKASIMPWGYEIKPCSVSNRTSEPHFKWLPLRLKWFHLIL